jgi:hypothetical protein
MIISVVGVLANAGAVIIGRNANREGSISSRGVTFISMGFGDRTAAPMNFIIRVEGGET